MSDWQASDRPLLWAWPQLAAHVRFAPLAALPTPVVPLTALMDAAGLAGIDAWDKRDDLTAPAYGGNKVRTLEVLMGRALDEGATHLYATGAYGSNHAAANLIHAPRVGLTPGAVLYPQPHSRAALENLEMMLAARMPLFDLPHWSALPFGMVAQSRRSARAGERAVVMLPGGAEPHGALGYVSAGLELAHQVAAGAMPAPRTVVVAVGSNCSSAGLLVGFAIAARRGIGWTRAPQLVAVRVTPWPVTIRPRIVGLARDASRLLARLAGDGRAAIDARELSSRLTIATGFLGRGYGYPTAAGRRAMRLFAEHAGHALETTYSGKSAAALIDLAARGVPQPILYWTTKSSAPLPPVDASALAHASPRMRRWMRRARALPAPV